MKLMKRKGQKFDGNKKKKKVQRQWTNYRRQRMTGIARSTRSTKKNHHVGDTVAASSAAFEAKSTASESSIFVLV